MLDGEFTDTQDNYPGGKIPAPVHFIIKLLRATSHIERRNEDTPYFSKAGGII